MNFDSKDTTTIVDLITELSTEIDLQYDDDDLPAVEASIAVLRAASNLLVRLGGEIPEACIHVIRRFEAATGEGQ